MNGDAVVDVGTLDDLGLEALEVFDLDPQVGAHAGRAVDAAGVAQQQRILAVVAVKAGKGEVAVLGLGRQRAGVIEGQRVGELGLDGRTAAGPGAAVLQQLAVLVIGMAHGPVGEHAAVAAQVGGLDHQRGDGAMDIGLAHDGDTHLVEDSVGGAGHNAQLVLQGVPALDGTGVAAVLLDQALHGDGQSCDRGNLVLGDADLKAVVDVGKHGGHGLLVGLGVAHGLDKLGHGDGRKLNVELLEQLALVAHGRPEVERAGGHLQDAGVLEGLDHVAHGQEVPNAALELGVGQAAVGHIGEGNLEAAKYLAGGEQAALAIAQAGAVGLGALVARTPQQHGQAELAGKAGANVLGAKVGVAQHDAVDALGAELFDDRLDMAVVEQQTLIVDVVDIHDVDADLAQAISRQPAILDRVRRAKDAAARGHKTELDLIHVRPPLITCSVNRCVFRFVLFTKCFTLLFRSLTRNTRRR